MASSGLFKKQGKKIKTLKNQGGKKMETISIIGYYLFIGILWVA